MISRVQPTFGGQHSGVENLRRTMLHNSPWMIAARHMPGELRTIYPGSKELMDAIPKMGPFDALRANGAALASGMKALLAGNNPVAPAVEAYVGSRLVMDRTDSPPLAGFTVPDLELKTDNQKYKKLFNAMHHAWPALVRKLDAPPNGSLIPLPNAYVVPGGKFKEMYYWDSYFIMLGLKVSGLNELMAGMTDNFLHLSEEMGIVPNANRTYYNTRTQPPFLTEMIQMAQPYRDKAWLAKAYQTAQKDYENVWMNPKTRFVEDFGLNRYYDPNGRRMPENNRSGLLRIGKPNLAKIRNARAECESGWDFTKRFDSRCTDFLPVDLNSLLYRYEKDMAGFAKQLGKDDEAKSWQAKADKRGQLIRDLMWDEKTGLFYDYDFKNKKRSEYASLASYFPLWAGVATEDQGKRSVEKLREFEGAGGLKTSLYETGEQWDAPNGWPNLNWIAIKAAQQYEPEYAKALSEKWLNMVEKVQQTDGAVFEKYNVVTGTKDTLGHYPSQALFGWGLGVALGLMTDVLGYQVQPRK